MYKYFFAVWSFTFNVTVCEFMSGVTVQDSNVVEIFETAEALYRDDSSTRATIEDFYEQYVCLLACRDKRHSAPLNDNGIIDTLNSLIRTKNSVERK